MSVIRRARPEDAAALAELAERTFRDAFGATNDPVDMDLHCARRFGPAIQESEIRDPELITLLAEGEDGPIGFAQLRLDAAKDCVVAERPAELHRIYVLESRHGRGIAQGLMREVLTAAAQSQVDRIWLGVWEENPRAMAFYVKHGFEVVGEHVFRFGTDMQTDLIMAATVAEPPVA